MAEIAIENGDFPIEIVSFPINNGDSPVRYVNVYQRVFFHGRNSHEFNVT